MKPSLKTPRRHLLLSTGLILSILCWCMASTASAALFIGFEEGEGYETGALGGQNGWTALGSSPNSFLKVTDAVSKTGEQSLSVERYTGGGNTPYVRSPDVSAQGYTTITFSTRASVAPTGAADNFNYTTLRLFFSDAETLDSSDRFLSLDIRQTNNGELGLVYTSWSGSDSRSRPYISLENILNPTDWNEFQITLSPTSGSYSVIINGTPVVTNVNLHSHFEKGASFANLTVYSYTSPVYEGVPHYTGTVYYDDITFAKAIPEPGTALLLLMVGLGGCIWGRACAKR